MKPIKITRQTGANSVVSRWKKQYRGISSYDREKLVILENLRSLGATPEPDKVDAIIGNNSWTSVPGCDCCGEPKELIVRVGEEPDYESHTAYVCRDCLLEALKLTEEGL